MQPATTLTYINRETGQTTTIQRKPNFEVISISVAGLIHSVTERQTIESNAQNTKNQAPPGNNEQSTKNNERVVRHEYDSLGRKLATIDPRTGKTTVEYEPKTGQIAKSTDAAGNATTYAYYGPEEPNAGKLKSTTNALGKTQSFTYNARGQKITSSGETDYPTCHEYDDYGQLVKLITFREEPLKETKQGAAGGPPTRAEMLTSIATPDVTTWVHDEATGVLLKKIYADGKGPTYEYHPDGRLKKRTWARGLQTHYEYDPTTLAQIKTWYADAEGNPIEETHSAPIILQHNRSGQVIAVDDATGRRTFERDEFGREIAEVLPNGQRIERNYEDDSGQLSVVRLFQPKGIDPVHQVVYNYKPDGTIAAVDSGSGRFEYEYAEDAPNLLKSLTGPAVRTTYEYEPNRNLITQVHNQRRAGLDKAQSTRNQELALANAQGTRNQEQNQTISSFDYTNDQIGRRVEVAMAGENLENSGWHWAYNDRSELVSAKPKLETEKLKLHTYSYDDLGNRETVTEGDITTTYQSNALNQYTTAQSPEQPQGPESEIRVPNSAFEYDLDGNLVSDDDAVYSWNANNRLVRVETKSGVFVTYQYDYLGRRTRKTVHQYDGSTTQNEFIYDGWNVIQETITTEAKHKGQNAKNSATRYYTWGRDLSGALQASGGVGGLLSIRIENGDSESELLYPRYDANGNITEVVDVDGKIRAAFQYGPFGNLLAKHGDLAEQIPFRFSTKYVDSETGFLYYGIRHYNNESARWINRDPLSEFGGTNLYQFVSNRPIDYFDYLGAVGDTLVPQSFITANFSNPQLSQTTQQAASTAYGRLVGSLRGLALAINVAYWSSVSEISLSIANDEWKKDPWNSRKAVAVWRAVDLLHSPSAALKSYDDRLTGFETSAERAWLIAANAEKPDIRIIARGPSYKDNDTGCCFFWDHAKIGGFEEHDDYTDYLFTPDWEIVVTTGDGVTARYDGGISYPAPVTGVFEAKTRRAWADLPSSQWSDIQKLIYGNDLFQFGLQKEVADECGLNYMIFFKEEFGHLGYRRQTEMNRFNFGWSPLPN